MIGVKTGTQTWSRAEQVSSLRGDGTKTMSAVDEQKVLGGKEDLGEVLNKIADPNWVDPKKARRVGNDELDKDAFLKLFLAQLKNQDPTNTMDSHELAAQLAQFTSLEKLNSIDEGISALGEKNKAPQNFEVLSMVGRTVSGDSSKIIRTDSKQQHEIAFNLAANADVAEVSIRNATGQEVRKIELRGLKQGPNKYDWDGRLENGTPAKEGDYNVVITAKNGAQKIHAETKFQGRVTGVNFTGQGPVLMLGNQSVRLSEVKGIVDPEIEASESSLSNAHKVTKAKDLKARDGNAPDMTVVGMAGNMENVGMQQGLVNKIEKQLTEAEKRAASQENQPNEGEKKIE